jgi:hypothetical protein
MSVNLLQYIDDKMTIKGNIGNQKTYWNFENSNKEETWSKAKYSSSEFYLQLKIKQNAYKLNSLRGIPGMPHSIGCIIFPEPSHQQHQSLPGKTSHRCMYLLVGQKTITPLDVRTGNEGRSGLQLADWLGWERARDATATCSAQCHSDWWCFARWLARDERRGERRTQHAFNLGWSLALTRQKAWP